MGPHYRTDVFVESLSYPTNIKQFICSIVPAWTIFLSYTEI